MTTVFSSVLLLAAAGGSAWAQPEEEADPCSGDPVEAGAGAEVGAGADGAVAAEPPVEGADAAAMEGGKPPLILAKGKLAVAVTLGVNLSKDAVAKPLTINPDVWYGVMPKLEVGVAHSSYGITGFWGESAGGGGLCVTGTDSGCAKVYNGPVGVLGHFLLMDGSIDLAADGGFVARTLDPMALGLKVGVMGRWMSGKIMVSFSPNILIGLTERDTNKELISVPVSVGFAASPKLHAGVQTGISGPLDGFGDFNIVPVSAGALFMVNDQITAGGSFSFLNLAGSNSSADSRGLTVFAMWHN